MHQLFVMLGPGVIFEAANFTLVEKTPPPAPAFQDYLSYRKHCQSLPISDNLCQVTLMGPGKPKVSPLTWRHKLVNF